MMRMFESAVTDNNMNIAFLIFSFNVGGIERLLIDMADNMAKRGNNITLCVINNDFDEELLKCMSPEVDVVKLGRGIGAKSSLKYMLKLAKLVKDKKINILHCQGINCVIFSFLAKLMNPHIRIINTVHDVGNYPSYSDLKIAVQNLILDRTIAISHIVETEILKRIKDQSKVVTIYNAVDLSRFKVSDKSFDPENVMLCNVARFFPDKKGQDVLTEAVADYKECCAYEGATSDVDAASGVRCDFAGAVFKGQEEPYKKLQDYVASNNLQSNICFQGNVEDIPSFLKEHDIFVLPSRYEGFGIALIEALACGLPVVASDIDGPMEIFDLAREDGINIGYLAECGNPKDFAGKIRECVNCYSEYDKHKMREFVERHFSIDNMVEEHLKLYSSLCVVDLSR